MSRVCAHCGEVYPEKRLNCPHCGADADLPWSEPEYDPALDLEEREMDDSAYDEFLRKEGLAPGRPRRRAAAPLTRQGLLRLLVLLALLALLIWSILF